MARTVRGITARTMVYQGNMPLCAECGERIPDGGLAYTPSGEPVCRPCLGRGKHSYKLCCFRAYRKAKP